MSSVLEPNKTKIAKRVIEIFDFFDQYGQKATVMDIVRRYGRPQSSTSELLASLVEMGLLYKDPRSRFYSPTPRLASLGISSQPDWIRDGLFTFMNRLSQTTRRSVALFGMVGTHVQIFRRCPGPGRGTPEVSCGASEHLLASTVGLLLISTLSEGQSGRLVRRLIADAPESTSLHPAQISRRLTLYRGQGHAVGKLGFNSDQLAAATLLPLEYTERPLALGVLYGADEGLNDAKALIATMNNSVANLCESNERARTPRTYAPFRMAS